MNSIVAKPEDEPFNVCIYGASLDTGNLGVSALASSLFKLVRHHCPRSRISLLIGNRSSNPQSCRLDGRTVSIDVVNYRLSPKSKLQEHLYWIFFLACVYRAVPIPALRRLIRNKNSWVRTVIQADFIGDINGGDSFSDIYGISRMITGTMPSIITLILKKDLVLFPQTYGPFKSFFARKIARFILKRAKKILSRDKESINTIEETLGDHSRRERIVYCPDVAFTLDSILPDQVDIRPPVNLDSVEPLVGINVNGLMYNGGYSRDNMFGLNMNYRDFIIRLLERLLNETSCRILLVPHTFGKPGNVNSDPVASREALESLPDPLKSRVHMLEKKIDQNHIKGVISQCDFFIGSRMHSCIAALSQGVPTVGVAYSKKFIGVFNSIGLGEMVVDARAFDTESALDEVISRYSSREDVAVRLSEPVAEAKKTVLKTFDELFDDKDIAIACTKD